MQIKSPSWTSGRLTWRRPTCWLSKPTLPWSPLMQGLSSCVVAKGVVVTEVDATTSCTFEGDSGRGSCNYCCPASTSCPRAVSFPFLKSSSTVHSCADQCWCRATPMLRLCGWIWRWSRRLWSNLIGAWGAQLSKSFQQRRALLQLPLV